MAASPSGRLLRRASQRVRRQRTRLRLPHRFHGQGAGGMADQPIREVPTAGRGRVIHLVIGLNRPCPTAYGYRFHVFRKPAVSE